MINLWTMPLKSIIVLKWAVKDTFQVLLLHSLASVAHSCLHLRDQITFPTRFPDSYQRGNSSMQWVWFLLNPCGHTQETSFGRHHYVELQCIFSSASKTHSCYFWHDCLGLENILWLFFFPSLQLPFVFLTYWETKMPSSSFWINLCLKLS